MKRFRKILFVVDGSDIDEITLDHTIRFAEANSAQVTLIDVVASIPRYLHRLSPSLLQQMQLNIAREGLDRLCQKVKARVPIDTKLLEGTPFLEITREVQRNGYDLVVKSAEAGDSLTGLLFGTTDMHLLRKCPCPVWLIKPADRISFGRILAAVDFNELDPTDDDVDDALNREILEISGSVALLEQGQLYIAHAWEPVGEGMLRGPRVQISEAEISSYVREVRTIHRQWLNRLMSKAEGSVGSDEWQIMKPKIHLLNGDARDVIPDLASKLAVDLIVMGTVGRTGIPGLFIGNTAESVLNHVNCSVLAVKPEGFITPIETDD